ncbi:hypothetical protein FN846DRAFT_148256 [Sphaerosporella brunnea]|uniref:Uncharacterized protein n=1 Tax=Sphaerosporella brunnea TaxID=1250544 RepID=A0A5J5EQU5_9PEZI|nr:hypothetical protein FN846DRAFT_148256 [Sphaerosporella brunnea]
MAGRTRSAHSPRTRGAIAFSNRTRRPKTAPPERGWPRPGARGWPLRLRGPALPVAKQVSGHIAQRRRAWPARNSAHHVSEHGANHSVQCLRKCVHISYPLREPPRQSHAALYVPIRGASRTSHSPLGTRRGRQLAAGGEASRRKRLQPGPNSAEPDPVRMGNFLADGPRCAPSIVEHGPASPSQSEETAGMPTGDAPRLPPQRPDPGLPAPGGTCTCPRSVELCICASRHWDCRATSSPATGWASRSACTECCRK